MEKVIIVGGGLAGICIAHQLDDHHIPFKIIDRGVNHSTSVAAGMINPMTFRRLVKTWRCDEFIPFLKEYYPRIEQKINHTFFYPIKLRRVHSSKEEREMWENKVNDPDISSYISPPENENNTPKYVLKTFGNAFVDTPGYVDAKRFVRDNLNYFEKKGCLEIGVFNYEDLAVENKTYKGESFSRLIFAEGFEGEDNPYFGYLPFKNAKGEVLTVTSESLKKDEILNRKCFVLPTVDGVFKLGSTYSWNTKDTSPTEEGKQELLAMYNQLSTAPIGIVEHEAGIRPTSADRRPLIGEHPEHKGLFIFNGLGAKGFTYAPYFATEFVDFLLGKGTLDDEVNIQRFYKKFNLRKK